MCFCVLQYDLNCPKSPYKIIKNKQLLCLITLKLITSTLKITVLRKSKKI